MRSGKYLCQQLVWPPRIRGCNVAIYQDAAIYAAQDLAYERFDCGVLVKLEVGAMDVPLVIREEVRTIRVPHVVWGGGMTAYRYPIKTAAAEAALEEML